MIRLIFWDLTSSLTLPYIRNSATIILFTELRICNHILCYIKAKLKYFVIDILMKWECLCEILKFSALFEFCNSLLLLNLHPLKYFPCMWKQFQSQHKVTEINEFHPNLIINTEFTILSYSLEWTPLKILRKNYLKTFRIESFLKRSPSWVSSC